MSITGRIVGETYLGSDQHKPDLIFYVRTDAGKIRVVTPAPFEPHFFIKETDYSTALPVMQKFGWHRAVTMAEAKFLDDRASTVMRIEVHIPEVVRHMREALEGVGVKAYEADIVFTLNCKKAMGIDHNKVRIENYNPETQFGEVYPFDGEVPPMVKMYWDLECDDSKIIKGSIWKQAEKSRIIAASIIPETGGAPADSPPTKVEETIVEDSEDQLLFELNYHTQKETDLLIGWNSEDFDDKYLDVRVRMARVGEGRQPLQYDKHAFQTFDLYKIVGFKSERKRESDRLEDVVDDFLVKENKFGWTKTVERWNGHYQRFFLENRDKLRMVNLSHARAVRDIDRALEATDTRIAMADTAGCLVGNTYYYSQVIDSIMLRKIMRLPTRLIAGCRIRKKKDDYTPKEKREKFKGAIVFPPVPGQHEMVLHYDLVSLYNRIVQTFNISPELWVDVKDRLPKEIYDRIEEPGRIAKFPDDSSHLVPLLATLPEGLFPGEMRKVEAWRAELKAMKKKYGDDTSSAEYKKYSALDRAVKTLLLAFYGQLGEQKSRWYFRLMAELVTYAGRQLISRTAEALKEFGFEILYGDTDSIFCKLPGETDPDKLTQMGLNIAKFLNSQVYPEWLTELGIPKERQKLAIEFQEVNDTIFFGEMKKKYARWGHGEKVPEIIGFETIRSDWARIAKNMQKQVLTMRLEKKPKSDIAAFIESVKVDLMAGKLTNQLVISKGLKKNTDEYTAIPPHVRAAMQMEKAGTPLDQGESRVFYVITKATKGKISEVIPVMDKLNVPKPEPSGLIYYWQHQIYPPTERVLWGLFTDEEAKALKDCKKYDSMTMDFWVVSS